MGRKTLTQSLIFSYIFCYMYGDHLPGKPGKLDSWRKFKLGELNAGLGKSGN